MIEEIRELFQNFIALQLGSIRGDIRANGAGLQALDVKIESCRRELFAEIRVVEGEVRRVEAVLSSDLVRLEEQLDVRLAAMNEKMDLQRRELIAEIKTTLR